MADTILQTRPPIVAVMGHVDHGKTTLLDYIRKAKVAEREHGGITQHLGAYQVTTDDGRVITFLDTPGHAAFEGIRKRGGEVADIVILVVAANDGVMPQTLEAIRHIKNSGSSMIVAINKVDLEDANVDRVKQQLAEADVLLESWGGDIVSLEISAKTGKGVPELLDMIALVADLLDLKAEYDAPVTAFCLESRMDKAGPIASVLVTRGTLRMGMDLMVDTVPGRIRSLKNERGEQVSTATPAQAVEVNGFPKLPEAGHIFIEENGVLSTSDNIGMLALRHVALENQSVSDLFASAGHEIKYPVIIKADTVGSLEAILHSMPARESVDILDQGVGDVNEAEVMKARGTNARIYAFNVGLNGATKRLASEEKVTVKTYRIIYKLFEDMEADITVFFTKPITETISGRATILKVFSASAGGNIAGVKVSEGVMSVGATVRILREGVEIGNGKITTAKRLKDDVQRLSAGQEGGLTIDAEIPFAEGDIIEYYKPINRS